MVLVAIELVRPRPILAIREVASKYLSAVANANLCLESDACRADRSGVHGATTVQWRQDLCTQRTRYSGQIRLHSTSFLSTKCLSPSPNPQTHSELIESSSSRPGIFTPQRIRVDVACNTAKCRKQGRPASITLTDVGPATGGLPKLPISTSSSAAGCERRSATVIRGAGLCG